MKFPLVLSSLQTASGLVLIELPVCPDPPLRSVLALHSFVFLSPHVPCALISALQITMIDFLYKIAGFYTRNIVQDTRLIPTSCIRYSKLVNQHTKQEELTAFPPQGKESSLGVDEVTVVIKEVFADGIFKDTSNRAETGLR